MATPAIVPACGFRAARAYHGIVKSRIADLRERLLRGREASTVFDLPQTTRNLEAAYSAMWRRWCAGESPAGFRLNGA